jgi:hypothetical protein
MSSHGVPITAPNRWTRGRAAAAEVLASRKSREIDINAHAVRFIRQRAAAELRRLAGTNRVSQQRGVATALLESEFPTR